jgi:hypothetical protein
MRRRDFIKAAIGAVTVWPLATRAQQPALPVVAVVNLRSAEDSARVTTTFRKGLDEVG